MNEKITIVTAFFPINRAEWKNFDRSNNKYIEYFKFWACIHNDMIIYTTPEFKDEIMKIRREYGRSNTEVVTIENIYDIDRKLYDSILKVSKNRDSINFRFQPNSPESWNAEYNYIMILKEWAVVDAIKRYNLENTIAWVDFGFNHGGEVYTNPEDFNFEWNYNFGDKINLFLKHKLDDSETIFNICRRMDTYVQGSVIVGPCDKWKKLWPMIRSEMIALNKVGLMDDDQTLLLMAYREDPEIFETHLLERWHSVFLHFSNQKFSFKKMDEFEIKGLKKIKMKLAFKKLVLKYSLKWNKILNKKETLG